MYSTASSKAACATPTAPIGSAGPREVERLHRDLEALALGAEPVRGRDDDVLERDGRRVGRPLAHLVEVLLDRDAGRVHRHDERREALGALAAVGRGEAHHPGSVAGVRDEHLRPVDHVLIALGDRRRLDAGHVGAGARLGEPEAAEDRRLDERPEPLLLLLVGAGDQDRAGAEAVGADRGADARAAPVELLADQHAVEAGKLRPAEPLRQVQVHEADLVRLGDDVGRMRLMLVTFRRARPDLVLRERAREGAQLLLLIAEGEGDAAGDTRIDCGHSEHSLGKSID